MKGCRWVLPVQVRSQVSIEIHNNGGQIAVESEEGKGTIFRLLLPLVE
jgi:signal transduction histidine kinase